MSAMLILYPSQYSPTWNVLETGIKHAEEIIQGTDLSLAEKSQTLRLQRGIEIY
jgi:hypothetical protein